LLAPGGSGGLSTAFYGTVTNPNGKTTTVTFDRMGHTTSVGHPDGGTRSASVDDFGFPASMTDADGRTLTYTYNSVGSPTVIERLSGHSGGSGGGYQQETISYGVDQVPTSITDFAGNTTTFSLDSGGNILRRTDPDGLHEDWTYNAAGQVLTDTDRGGHTT